MHVLIAEDDGVTRQIVAEMLRKWGYEVAVAFDGNHAWELLRRPDAPYLALLDWMMPGLNGVELCSRLRRLERDISPYVILLTGMNTKKDLLKGFDSGADDYLTKPFDPDELRVRVRAGERIVNLQIESLAAREALRKLATYDFLTGLRNRAAILEELQRKIEHSLRKNDPMSVVMADVDHFKKINDTYGHQVGDKVLAELAKQMASEVRSYEVLGRYGGEEFLIVLSDCDVVGARTLAERLRRAIARKEFFVKDAKISVTISLGVASSTQLPRVDQEVLVDMADNAMYCAKLAGRNRVELAAVDQWKNPFLSAGDSAIEPLGQAAPDLDGSPIAPG